MEACFYDSRSNGQRPHPTYTKKVLPNPSLAHQPTLGAPWHPHKAVQGRGCVPALRGHSQNLRGELKGRAIVHVYACVCACVVQEGAVRTKATASGVVVVVVVVEERVTLKPTMTRGGSRVEKTGDGAPPGVCTPGRNTPACGQ